MLKARMCRRLSGGGGAALVSRDWRDAGQTSRMQGGGNEQGEVLKPPFKILPL